MDIELDKTGNLSFICLQWANSVLQPALEDYCRLKSHMALVDLDAADTNTVVDVPCMLTEKFSLISLVMPKSVNLLREVLEMLATELFRCCSRWFQFLS